MNLANVNCFHSSLGGFITVSWEEWQLCEWGLLSSIGSAEGAKIALLQRAAIFMILRSRSVTQSCKHAQEVLLGYYFQIQRQ